MASQILPIWCAHIFPSGYKCIRRANKATGLCPQHRREAYEQAEAARKAAR